jgi:hypothetical protein
MYTIRHVTLTAEQQRMYSDLRDDAVTRLAGEAHVSAPQVITQLLRMHQLLCGHVVDEEGQIHQVPQKRDDALVEILEEHTGKTIVWVPYGPTLLRLVERIRREFGPRSVACVWAGTARRVTRTMRGS